MNLSKKAFALFLLASLTAGQAQAVTFDSIWNNLAQFYPDTVTKLINEKPIPILLMAASTLLFGWTTYECYDAYQTDPSTRIISIPAIPFFALGTIGLGAFTAKLVYDGKLSQ